MSKKGLNVEQGIKCNQPVRGFTDVCVIHTWCYHPHPSAFKSFLTLNFFFFLLIFFFNSFLLISSSFFLLSAVMGVCVCVCVCKSVQCSDIKMLKC